MYPLGCVCFGNAQPLVGLDDDVERFADAEDFGTPLIWFEDGAGFVGAVVDSLGFIF